MAKTGLLKYSCIILIGLNIGAPDKNILGHVISFNFPYGINGKLPYLSDYKTGFFGHLK